MSVRAVDTFYLKGGKQLTVLANRGLNGIDGTVSTAIGASRCFGRTTLITGDLTMQHDLNALALQRELRVQRQLADALSISDKTVSKWECGKGLPEVSLMLPLCGALQITVNDLLTGAVVPKRITGKERRKT